MAQRRFYRRDERAPSGPRVNERIRISPIRLIDETGEMVGVVDLEDARRRAQEAGLDLVEIAADVKPPVVRIMDYGKYKYEQAKKEKANKAKSKVSELKEVRMGRSMKIDPHDVQIRLQQARRFLLEGHKVQIVQNFRGREIAHRERGNERMQEIINALIDIGKLETAPRLAGRRMTMIIGPDKPKIEIFKRQHPEAFRQQSTAVTPPPPDDDDDDDDTGDESGVVETGAEEMSSTVGEDDMDAEARSVAVDRE